MTPSIRTFLLINLLLSVTLITSLAIIGNLFLERKDIQKQLDLQLINSALTIHALIGEETKTTNIIELQKRINAIPSLTRYYYDEGNPDNVDVASFPSYKVQFQVWDKNGNLLLRSTAMPALPLYAKTSGFNNLILDNFPWRIFTSYAPNNNLIVVVAERFDFRERLESRITQDSILIMLITYPFLGILIWIIVGRGLGILKQVTNEVRNRAPTNLKPVDLDAVPTEIKPLVNELNTLFLRVKEAFERETRFAADAAHELRTPLAALKAQTQVALRAITAEDRVVALHKVLDGVNRSAHVVQQLLTISRMGPQSTPNELVPVDLSRQAAEVIAEIAPEAFTKDTEIELIPDAAAGIITCNPTAINILIRNLIDNAVKYTQHGSLIRVIVVSDDDTVTLKVIDNGPGIPEKLRQRVFERFFRILGNKSPGSGLGLGIVEQVAKLHHAKLTLTTASPPPGLEVKVVFPKHPPVSNNHQSSVE